MIPSDSLHLLSQDNSIPGNRKDGFRYHHLLFVIVLTPIYLWFELSFGVALLDTMGNTVIIDDTRNIEHWGRLISGAAVALLLLSGWIQHWEAQDMSWRKGLPVALGIVLVSMIVTWWAQGRILGFYVERTTAELRWALSSMAFLLLTSFFMVRLWLQKAATNARSHRLWLVLALIVVLGIGYAQTVLIRKVTDDRDARLGVERQRTATMTIIRRGLQENLYALPEADLDARSLHSPEGMSYLALFPVFGVMYDSAQMAAARPALIGEFMYRDWQRDYGAQAYAGYQVVEQEIADIYAGRYRASAVPVQLGERSVPPRLTQAQFYGHPNVQRYLSRQLACFDCRYTMGMAREAFGREHFANARTRDVASAVQTFSDPKQFESGRNGERAARTYWAPILALLFSMLGTFTHVFKLLVTLTAYFQRQTFSKIDAADSEIANKVIVNSSRVTAGAVIALALFVYFYENRITGNPNYIAQRATLWQERPLVGAIAAHWTVNAQGLVYPFTKKLKPDWLAFDIDPVQKIPLVRDWFAAEEFE